MQTLTSVVYLEGLVFGECPRWRDGALWLSDMFGGRVLRSTGAGKAETVLEIKGGRPSGLAFLDDGSLLVVSMLDRKLLRRWPDGRVEPFADLAPHVAGDINDMVRAPDGGVFVGNFGFDLFAGAEGRLTNLHHVDSAGKVREVASELNFPNGMVITPDRRTLIVAETFAHRLTAFDLDGGQLRNRRVFAQLGDYAPDGICLDAAGAVWVSAFVGDAYLRIFAPKFGDDDPFDILTKFFSLPYCPVRLDDLSVRVDVVAYRPGDSWQAAEGATIATTQVNHPGGCAAIRVSGGGGDLVYASDAEILNDVDARALADFARGADLFIADAMNDETNAAARRGWGHSNWRDAVAVGEAAGAQAMALFHHDPRRSDIDLAAIDARVRAIAPQAFLVRQGCALSLGAIEKTR